MRIRVVSVLLLLASHLGAQDVARRITGTVRATSDSAVLAQVHVAIRGVRVSTLTNGSGTFVIEQVPTGQFVLEVRRLGFRAIDLPLSVGADTSIVIYMTPLPQRLAEIEVGGKRILIRAHMRPIYERADRNHGTLITASDIERVFPQDTKSMLQGIAGIHVETRTIRFVRCSNPQGAASPFRGSPPKVHVYVNGSRHSVTGSSTEALAIIQSVHPNDIELMEVYGGVTRIPAEFLVDACAVVAIWTKAY